MTPFPPVPVLAVSQTFRCVGSFHGQKRRGEARESIESVVNKLEFRTMFVWPWSRLHAYDEAVWATDTLAAGGEIL